MDMDGRIHKPRLSNANVLMGWTEGGRREGGREGGEVAWPPKAFGAVRGGTKPSNTTTTTTKKKDEF